MLTFKHTLEDAEAAFDHAVDQRETFIHNLLAVFHADRTTRWPINIVTALNNLSTAQDDFDTTEQEWLRLEHIETVIDKIVDPFPPHIAAKLRAAGIDDETQRETARELLADEGDDRVRRWLEGDWEIPDDDGLRTSPFKASFMHVHEPHEMPDAPWQTADIGGGTVEYAPGTGKSKVPLTPMERGILMHKILEGKFEGDPIGRARAIHEIIEDVGNSSLVDLLDDDDRPSLHGDGHVGPVARHAAQAAHATSGFSIHDLLEAISEPSTRKSKTGTLLDDMREEVERAMGRGERK